MPDKKVSDLTAATTPLAGTELVPIVQSGTSKKVAQSDLAVPADGSITGAKIASAIKDADAGTASLRTLGTSSTSAMAGNTTLSSIAAPTADVSLNSKKITNLATPTAGTDAVNKTYSDTKANLNGVRGSLNQSTAAFDTLPRQLAGGSPAYGNGVIIWAFFTALHDLTVSQISFASVSATGTPTLVRFGLYTWDESSTTVTLVARTANDTTIFSGTSTIYTRSFDTAGGYPSTYDLTAGTRYALAAIQVATTAASISGSAASTTAIMSLTPRLSGSAGSQTDLVTSRSTFTNPSSMPWARVS